jgi:hypothetical protein
MGAHFRHQLILQGQPGRDALHVGLFAVNLKKKEGLRMPDPRSFQVSNAE